MTLDQPGNVERRGVAAFVRRFPQVHLAIGLLGNALFIAGSVLFLLQHRDIGVYAFLVGSSAMFVGAFGEALRGLGNGWLKKQAGDE